MFVLQAYTDCVQLQVQQNLAQRAIDRLQSAIGLRLPVIQNTTSANTLLRQASTDKLRYVIQNTTSANTLLRQASTDKLR